MVIPGEKAERVKTGEFLNSDMTYNHDSDLLVLMSPAYLSPLASNILLVPSRLAFLQRSASGTVLPAA